MAAALAVALAAVVTGVAPRCRCLSGDVCWDGLDWTALNRSVGGRLQPVVDELTPCLIDIAGCVCSQALEGSDDEFWLTARPGGYLHTGIFGAWNLTTTLPAFAVEAESELDIQATVRFAAEHNLRLVVKATGHDWYGRSAAGGGLMLWTHRRKNITWHDAFFPAGSPSDVTGVPAVTVQSGVQFSDLYPAAQRRRFPGDPVGRRAFVMGGGCDSVGVGGCWLGGCFGKFTKKFGNAAVNLLEARVVLANGTLVTTSETAHPDLFWTLRGGGGGNTAVVTEFTARVHPAPQYVVRSGVSGSARSGAGFRALLKRVLKAAGESTRWPLEHQCVSSSTPWNVTGRTAGVGCMHYEGDPAAIEALYRPVVAWCAEPAQRQLGIACHSYANVQWNQTDYIPDAHIWDNASFIPENAWVGNEPWISFHPDREISTAMVGSVSKYIPIRGLESEASADAMVDSIVQVGQVLANMSRAGFGISVQTGVAGATGDKAQSGMPPEVEARFNATAQNPVLLDAVSFWLIMLNIPSLPQLPPSSRLLRTLWPRLQQYAVRSQLDPLWSVCESGAQGSEADAGRCLGGWHARVPVFQAQLADIRRALNRAFPNEVDGAPYSGSYWNEADFDDTEWQKSSWGVHYPRLLALKKQYDPAGLFYGHHAVGSELWSADGNCRV